MDTANRVGDWMQTASGRKFWPLDPRPEDVAIEDIAHALSHVCRFGGHCRTFYSVAEHSVRVSIAAEIHAGSCDIGEPRSSPRPATPSLARLIGLHGLLHDAAEAYIGDMVRPLKRQSPMRAFVEAEERVYAAICKRFGLTVPMPPSVGWADEALLATEARDIMGGESAVKWTLHVAPLPDPIVPWTPEKAREEFLGRFSLLTGAV